MTRDINADTAVDTLESTSRSFPEIETLVVRCVHNLLAYVANIAVPRTMNAETCALKRRPTGNSHDRGKIENLVFLDW
jgi:hypothetical protein